MVAYNIKLRKIWDNLVDMVIYKCRWLCNLTWKRIGWFLNSWNKFIVLDIELHHVRLVIWYELLYGRRGHWLVNILLHSWHILILRLLILLIFLILPIILIINRNLASYLLLILLLILLRTLLILLLFFLKIFILHILLISINCLLRIILRYLSRIFWAWLWIYISLINRINMINWGGGLRNLYFITNIHVLLCIIHFLIYLISTCKVS